MKRGGACLFWSAHGNEGGKHTSAISTTFPSAGVAVVLRVCHITPRVLSLLTLQNLSVTRENGTRVLFAHVEFESINVSRSAHDEDSKYQVNVTAYNHFGFSQSDPVSFWLKDKGEISHLTVT